MAQVLSVAQQNMPANNTQIYVLALDSTGSIWQRMSDQWQIVVGSPSQASQVDNTQEIGVRFLDILTQAVARLSNSAAGNPPISLQPGENHYDVPPLTREMRISIFKSSNSPGVLTVTQPDGSVLQEGSQLTIQNRDRPIEVWTITQPQPGQWAFNVGNTGDRLDVKLQLIPVEIYAQFQGGPFLQFGDVPLTVQFMDDQGAPLPVYAAPYTLQANAALTLPDGSQQNLLLPQTNDGGFAGTFTANQRGDYTLGVTASFTGTDGKLHQVFNQNAVGKFTVLGVNYAVSGLSSSGYLVGDQLVLAAQISDDQKIPSTILRRASPPG